MKLEDELFFWYLIAPVIGMFVLTGLAALMAWLIN
jgi:hypothetical protein